MENTGCITCVRIEAVTYTYCIIRGRSQNNYGDYFFKSVGMYIRRETERDGEREKENALSPLVGNEIPFEIQSWSLSRRRLRGRRHTRRGGNYEEKYH